MNISEYCISGDFDHVVYVIERSDHKFVVIQGSDIDGRYYIIGTTVRNTDTNIDERGDRRLRILNTVMTEMSAHERVRISFEDQTKEENDHECG